MVPSEQGEIRMKRREGEIDGERDGGRDALGVRIVRAGRHVITGYQLRVRTFIYLHLPAGNFA